jgi:hypothetical protein
MSQNKPDVNETMNIGPTGRTVEKESHTASVRKNVDML